MPKKEPFDPESYVKDPANSERVDFLRSMFRIFVAEAAAEAEARRKADEDSEANPFDELFK